MCLFGAVGSLLPAPAPASVIRTMQVGDSLGVLQINVLGLDTTILRAGSVVITTADDTVRFAPRRLRVPLNGELDVELPAGAFTVEYTPPGGRIVRQRSQTTAITANNRTRMAFRLDDPQGTRGGTSGQPGRAEVLIYSNRDGDRILVNGTYQATTPDIVVVPAGAVRFRVVSEIDTTTVCTWAAELQANQNRCYLCDPTTGLVAPCPVR
jgi:hypothetical protein